MVDIVDLLGDDSTDGERDDDDVVIVDPPPKPPPKGLSAATGGRSRWQHCQFAMKGQRRGAPKGYYSTTEKAESAAIAKQRKCPGAATMAFDCNSDSDDEVFLSQIQPSGLTRSSKPANSPPSLHNCSHVSSKGLLMNDSRPMTITTAPTHHKQQVDQLQGGSRATDAAWNAQAGASTTLPSDMGRGKPLRASPKNPYAKPKNATPAALRRNSSLGRRSVASSGSRSITTPLSLDKSRNKALETPRTGARGLSSLGDRSSASSRTTGNSVISSTRRRPIVENAYRSSGKKITPKQSSSSSSLTIKGSHGVCYPRLREKTKLWPDLRANIVLALWKFSRSNLTRDSYKSKQLDQYTGRIVDLTVTAHDFPVRSLGEYAFRIRTHAVKRGCGGVSSADVLKRLGDCLDSTGAMRKSQTIPVGASGKGFFSIAEACLVAMKEVIVQRWNRRMEQQQQQPMRFPTDEASQRALLSQRDSFVSLVELIPEIDGRLRPECPAKLGRKSDSDYGAAFYLAQSTISAEFKQIEKLLAPIDVVLPNGSVAVTAYLKKRSIGGKQHYELTTRGFERATVIAGRTMPAPIGHYRSSNLERVHPKYDQICLAVDLREGGGGDTHRKVLHEMCNKLDMKQIPYFVNTLKIGDYCFFSGDKLCPILVERKSVEDVAKSIDIDDGRWITQKHRMYQGQFVFGYDNCRMAYIIEGKVEKELVSNGFIGNARHRVSRERFDKEIANLEKEGFHVLRTSSVENSMFELAKWAESVARDVRSGRLTPQFTYNEFVEEVKKIPPQTNFSKLAKYHAELRKNLPLETVDLISDDDENDNDIETSAGGMRPIVLDERLRQSPSQKRPVPVLGKNATTRVSVGAQKRFKLEQTQPKEVRRQPFDGSCLAVYTTDISENAPPLEVKADTNSRSEKKNEYSKWTLASLKSRCTELGMKKTGNKTELIERLVDPTNHPPEVYRLRCQRGLYVPTNLDSAATAILVAIQIRQDGAPVGFRKYAGGTKDELYTLADAIDIKKDPFSGGTTQTGPYHYDGWSSMAKLKEPGDPPLVIEHKRRFRLSTTGDVSGLKLARAMHIWCHLKGICRCIENGNAFQPETWTKL